MTYRPQLDKVSLNDTTPNYLENKLVAGSGIALTVNNDGANETLSIAGTGIGKVSSSDTTAGYLASKLLAGTDITITIGNDGANETMTFAASFTGEYWEPLITGDTDPCEFILDDDFDLLMVQV